mgnify:CR=1 FL=1
MRSVPPGFFRDTQIRRRCPMDDDVHVRALRQHLLERGAYINEGIACAAIPSPGSNSTYRGVKALRRIGVDEVLVSIPEALLLSVRSARRDEDIGRATSTTGSELTDVQLLAVHLLHEASKGSASAHHAYLRTLPESYDSFLYMKDTDIELLASSHPHAAQEAAAAKAKLVEEFRAAKPVLADLNIERRLASLGAYRWANAVIQSRTMYLVGDAVGCLTPYGDLTNHTPVMHPVTPWTKERGDEREAVAVAVAGEGYFDEADQRYKLVTREAVDAGDQVFLTYGRLTNLQLMGLYGFVLPDNPFDTYVVARSRFPEAIQRNVTQAACFLNADGSPSFELLRAVRLGVLRDAERKRWAGVILDDRPVEEDESCEARAVEALRHVVNEVARELVQEIGPKKDTDTDAMAIVDQFMRSQAGILARCLARLY